MIRNTVLRVFALSAFAFLATAGVRSDAQSGMLSARCDAGSYPTNGVCINAVCTASDGAVSGYFDVQTPLGACDGKIATLDVAEYCIGVKFAYGTALGYYVPNAGGASVPSVISFVIIESADGTNLVQVSLTEYRAPHTEYYNGDLMGVISGLVVVDPE
jgi:hypothetical protein